MRSRRVHRRNVQPRGSGVGLVVAAVALVGVMGVVVIRKNEDKRRVVVREQVRERVVELVAPEPVARVPKPRSPVSQLKAVVRRVEKKLPDLKHTERGPGFETKRVALLSEISDTRDKVGAYLDDHPSDDAANDLWDRVLRLYVALKKL